MFRYRNGAECRPLLTIVILPRAAVTSSILVEFDHSPTMVSRTCYARSRFAASVDLTSVTSSGVQSYLADVACQPL